MSGRNETVIAFMSCAALTAGAAMAQDTTFYPAQVLTVDYNTFATQIDSLDVNTQTDYVWPDTYAGEIDLGGGNIIPFTTEFTTTVWRVDDAITLDDITLEVGDTIYSYRITMPFEAPGTIESGITEVQINDIGMDFVMDVSLVKGMGYFLPDPGVDVPVDLKIDDFDTFGSQSEWKWDELSDPRGELDNDETIELILYVSASVPVRADVGSLIGPFVPGGDDPNNIPLLLPQIPTPATMVGLGLGGLLAATRRRRV
jgi:hypothetical protein